MFAALCYVWLILGPDVVLTGSEPPAGRQGWNFVGTFRLADAKGRAVVARLYVEDSDLLGGWELAQRTKIPNSFAMHALYRAGDSRWKDQVLLSYGRVGFVRVKERTADGAVLEFRSNRSVRSDSLEQALKRIHTFTRAVSAKDGVPIIAD